MNSYVSQGWWEPATCPLDSESLPHRVRQEGEGIFPQFAVNILGVIGVFDLTQDNDCIANGTFQRLEDH